MKIILVTFALIACAFAWPVENKENIPVDTVHQTAASVEKPPESDMVRLEAIKSEPEAVAAAAEILPKEPVEIKTIVEPVAQPVAEQPEAVAAVVEVPETPVEAQASERVIVQVVPEPEPAVVAVVDEPIVEAVVDGKRVVRSALYGYPFNNYAGYGSWANKDNFATKYSYDSYGNQIPNVYGYGGYFAYPGHY